MRIAIYIGRLPAKKNAWSRRDWFIYETVSHMMVSRPECTFQLLSDEPVDVFFPNKNIDFAVIGRYASHFLSIYRQFNYKLPALLKHFQPDLLVSMTGILPLKLQMPSVLWVPDRSVSIGKVALREGIWRYKKRFLGKFLQNAHQVITVSEFCKQRLMSQYQVPDHKVTSLRGAVPENFQPLDWEAKEEVKARYTEGQEYILCVGDVMADSNIVNLLKAFSILKKKLASGMVLVFVGNVDRRFKKFPELFRTYHFRTDVIILQRPELQEMAALTAAAYAQIAPAREAVPGCSVIEALKCQVPVLAATHSVHQEIAGEAALYFDPENVKEMGEKLCEIYKSEDLCAQLVTQTDKQSALFQWESMIDTCWKTLSKAAGRKAEK